jgi:L-fucose mutarotase/ribose pyranase (RbsD/FucU family)
VLEAILRFFPHDLYIKNPVGQMEVVPGDNVKPVILEEYRKIIIESKESFKEFENIERSAFYKEKKSLCRNCY